MMLHSTWSEVAWTRCKLRDARRQPPFARTVRPAHPFAERRMREDLRCQRHHPHRVGWNRSTRVHHGA